MIAQEVLAIEDVYGLQRLINFDFRDRRISEPEINHILKLCDALWLHSGDPAQPHAELTSGMCSNGFVDVLRALRFTNLCAIFGQQLVQILEDEYDYYGKHGGGIDWVIGSDHAGAAISHSVATWLGAQHDFTVKGPAKQQLWQRFKIQPTETVLQLEELVTTTGTLRAVREGIREAHDYGIRFAPVVMTMVHRSEHYEFEGSPILYLVHYDIQTWQPHLCPLCQQGSKRLRPKIKAHWAELTGQ